MQNARRNSWVDRYMAGWLWLDRSDPLDLDPTIADSGDAAAGGGGFAGETLSRVFDRGLMRGLHLEKAGGDPNTSRGL
jgi:hypothetical protein